MIIKKLHLDNFGKFKGYTLELGSMFNVIHGENEDGKSTIMGFILMMFYGHGGRSGDISKNPRKKFRPWNGEEMKGRIQFEHEGTNYRLERTFGSSNTTDDITLWNEDIGQQKKLSSKVSPGEEFFGVGENAFLRSVFIGQGGSLLNADSKDDEITEKLLNLVTTGNEETSYEKAKNQLQNNEELLVSKNKKNGHLIRNRELLESLGEKKRVAGEQEKDKKDYATKVEQKRELKKQLENNKVSKERSYAGFSQYKLIKEHEDALKRVESRQTLLSRFNELEMKLTTPIRTLDQTFCIEGDNKIKTYKEVLSDAKHHEAEIEESKKIVAELESNIPKVISEEVFNSVMEKEKQRKKSEDILKMKKDELRENETLFQKLQEKKDRQLEYDKAKRNRRVAEQSYEKLNEEFEGLEKPLKMMSIEVEKLRSEGLTLENNIQNETNTKNLREEALTSFEKDLNEKLEDAKLQLENAKTPQEYVEEIQGGRELRKPMLVFALLALVAFIVLGILIDPILFAGLILSFLLFAFSFKKVENRTLTRKSINENLIAATEERLKKTQSDGENRRSIENNQIELLKEKIENLKRDLEIKKNELQENGVSLLEFRKDYETKKHNVEESKLQVTKLYSLMEAAEKELIGIGTDLPEKHEHITCEDLEDQKGIITSLEKQIESITQDLKDILSAYESESLEEFSEKFYKCLHHLESLGNRKKELQDNLDRQSNISELQKNTLEKILTHLRVYKALDNVSEAELALEEIRNLIDEKEKVSLQLNAIDEHRNELEKTMSSEALKENIRVLKGKLEVLTSQNEMDYTDLQKMEELKDSIEQTNKEITEVREEIISLESEVREKYRNSKNTSQIENEIQEAKQRVVLLELDYDSLKLAKETLIGAFEKMQCSFGPKVNKATEEVFERLTGGKYKEVMVSRDLNITFQDNSSQKMYDWAFLSGGTIEQAYLSLRLAISDLIIQDGKKRPLLLDDVFMQYDDKRAKDGLQFLKEYTSLKDVPIQSVLFTCHRRLIQWADEIPDVNVIELFSTYN